ncbi:MAG: TIGR03790 family protein [Tepidisphaeraceae bacterium]
MQFHRRFPRFALLAAMLCLAAFALRTALAEENPSAALEPDEILLITNKNSPDSQNLAAQYCQLRGVPPGQTVALDLPPDEEMSFQTYETGVVAPVRRFLNEHQLQNKVKCLLTFYGVPFRIAARRNTPADDRELAELQDLRAATLKELQQAVAQLETQTRRLDASFKPGVGDSIQALLARADAAMPSIIANFPTADAEQRAQLRSLFATIGGAAELDDSIGPAQRNDPTKSVEERNQLAQLHEKVLSARERVRRLHAARWDSQARSQLRHETLATFGLAGLLRVLDLQIEYFATDATVAATDNELALLWWDYYPRRGWLINPLNLSFSGRSTSTLMVMRLDGPDPATVRRMMQTSVDVEKTGIQGIIAIDARGLPPIDAKGNLNNFGEFDETLRHLAYLLRTTTDLKIKLGDEDLVFPAHSVKHVAFYCGWYSVANYIPGCDFNPGAVGYHVASFEMVTLHTPSSRWVRGLLKDGVVATLGPVAEPGLDAFPKPDEFFPLLLTGKLTMAQVYWKTTPFTSWMISFIGDPLYTPCKLHPPMKVEDLSRGLQRAFR